MNNKHSTRKQERIRKQSAAPSENSWWLETWHPFLLIALGAVIAYGWTISFGIVRFDDNLLRLESLPDAANSFSDILSPYLGSYFRPLLTASLDVDRWIGGGSIWVYHCSNVAYQGIACMIAYALIVRFGLSRRVALLAALVYAVHPISSQAVAWIPGRNDLLLTVCALSCVAAYLKAQSESLGWILLHWIMLGCALMVKETAIALPLALLATHVFLEWSPRAKRLLVVAGTGWMAIFAAWWFCRTIALRSVTGHEVTLTGAGLVANARSVLETLGKFVFPVGFSPYPVYGLLPTFAGFLFLLAGGIVVVKWRRVFTVQMAFALAWFFLFIAPALFVTYTDGQVRFDYLESRSHLACFGLVMLLATGIASVPRISTALKPAFATGIMVLLGILALRAAVPYRDQVTFWSRAVEDAPGSSHALFNRAVVAEEVEHNSATAIEWYRKAIVAGPRIALYRNSLGVLYRLVGQQDAARDEFRASIRVDSNYTLPLGNLAYMEYLDGRLDSAEMLWKHILRVDSNFADVEKNLVIIYARQGRMPEARYHLEHLKSRGITIDTALSSLVK